MTPCDFERFQVILRAAGKRMERLHWSAGPLDDYFLTTFREYLLDARATTADLERVAVTIVGIVAPALLERCDEPEITETEADQAELVLEHLVSYAGPQVH